MNCYEVAKIFDFREIGGLRESSVNIAGFLAIMANAAGLLLTICKRGNGFGKVSLFLLRDGEYWSFLIRIATFTCISFLRSLRGLEIRVKLKRVISLLH